MRLPCSPILAAARRRCYVPSQLQHAYGAEVEGRGPTCAPTTRQLPEENLAHVKFGAPWALDTSSTMSRWNSETGRAMRTSRLKCPHHPNLAQGHCNTVLRGAHLSIICGRKNPCISSTYMQPLWRQIFPMHARRGANQVREATGVASSKETLVIDEEAGRPQNCSAAKRFGQSDCQYCEVGIASSWGAHAPPPKI